MAKLKSISLNYDDGEVVIKKLNSDESIFIGTPLDNVVASEFPNPKKPRHGQEPHHFKTSILKAMEPGTGYKSIELYNDLPTKWKIEQFRKRINQTMHEMCRGDNPVLIYEDSHFYLTENA